MIRLVLSPIGRYRFWKRIKATALDTRRQFDEAQLLMVAGNLAYTTILSLIPALAVSFAIFKAFGGLDRLYNIVEPFVLTHLTEGAGDQAIEAMKGYLGNIHATVVGIGGFVGLILTTMLMLNAFESAINRAWKVPVTRPLFRRIAYYWLFITLGPLALSVAVGAATSNQVPIYSLLPNWVGLFAILNGLFFFVFKVVPNTRVQVRYALIAALTTSVLLELARRGYGLYTQHFVSYNKVYGSLGAVPILLVWIYILWVIILFGASLTAAMQNKLEPSGKAGGDPAPSPSLRVAPREVPRPRLTSGDKPDAQA